MDDQRCACALLLPASMGIQEIPQNAAALLSQAIAIEAHCLIGHVYCGTAG
jgi:hypothetical protein